MSDPQPTPSPDKDFAEEANQAPPSIAYEFLDFLLHNKKWWLTPIILVLLLVAALVLLGNTAPFIYTLF